jgi:hypothetical protein
MHITKTHLRAAAFVVGGAAVGAIATAATSAGRGEPRPFSGEPLTSTALPTESSALASAPTDPAADATAAAPRAAFGPEAPGAAVDSRFFVSPLSERFTQWSSGASNPGRRQAPHRDPLTDMIAAIFPTDESVRTVVLAPRVNPPPPPPDDETEEEEEEESEEPCDDEPCGGGDEVCPPADPTCETPPSGVPEIDANLLGSGLLLLIGGALVLASRRSL